MAIHKLFIYLIAFSTIPLFSQTNLSGSIGGMTLEKGGNPFIVSENITIPAGKSVTILNGCVFLFKPFTGIIVEGSIEVKGTAESPVLFTSFNNTAYNPKAPQPPDPFDWNGIIIGTKAHQVHLSNFTLSYSVYGIKSNRDDLFIDRGVFVNNGQFHFTIHDEIKAVADSLPFNYQPISDVISKTSPPAMIHPWKRPVSLIVAMAGTGGLGAIVYFYYKKEFYHSKYLGTPDSTLWDYNLSKEAKMIQYSWISGIVGGLFLSSGFTLFAFDLHDRKKALISYYEPVGSTYGLLFDMEL